jgi:hypothetical protein
MADDTLPPSRLFRRAPPPITSADQVLNVVDFEPLARDALPPGHFGYVSAMRAFHAGGELAVASAAGTRSMQLMLSNGSSTAIEEVEKARGCNSTPHEVCNSGNGWIGWWARGRLYRQFRGGGMVQTQLQFGNHRTQGDRDRSDTAEGVSVRYQGLQRRLHIPGEQIPDIVEMLRR